MQNKYTLVRARVVGWRRVPVLTHPPTLAPCQGLWLLTTIQLVEIMETLWGPCCDSFSCREGQGVWARINPSAVKRRTSQATVHQRSLILTVMTPREGRGQWRPLWRVTQCTGHVNYASRQLTGPLQAQLQRLAFKSPIALLAMFCGCSQLLQQQIRHKRSLDERFEANPH